MRQDWDQIVDVSHLMGQLLGAASAKLVELGALRRGQHVLDVGCGTGALTAHLASVVAGPQGGSALGVDASKAQIEAALHYFGAQPAVQFAVHDAHGTLGDADSYDAAFMRFALPNFANPTKVLANVYEVLKPGGRMCALGVADAPHNAFVQLLAHTNSPWVPHVLEWGSAEVVTNQLEVAGFEQVTTKRIRALVTVEDAAMYWAVARGLFGFPPEPMPPAIAEQLAPGTRLPLSLVFALGRKPDPQAMPKANVQSGEDALALARKKSREIAPLGLHQALKREQVVYLDVRAPQARVTKIKDALNITRDDLETTLPALVPDPTAHIIVFCQSGNQSAFASLQLRAMGYTNVWSLQGGIDAWEYVGLKTVPA